jgi:hypothetical protein
MCYHSNLMDDVWNVVMLEHREKILNSTDADDVFLDFLLDHVMNKYCIQRDQKELIKCEKLSRNRWE